MKLMIRYFSIGILTASLAFSVALYFFDDTSANLADESIESVIDYVENEGYRVITEDDYISLSINGEEENEDENEDEESSAVNDDGNEEENMNNKDDDQAANDIDSEKEESDQDETDDESEEDEEDEEDTAATYTLQVEENMLSPEVGELLVDNDIVDDAAEFARYLEEEEFSQYIQLGEHEVSSDMSFNELANVITGNN